MSGNIERKALRPDPSETSMSEDELVVGSQAEGIEAAPPDALARARAAMFEDTPDDESWAVGDSEDGDAVVINEDETDTDVVGTEAAMATSVEEQEAPGFARYFNKAWKYIRGLFTKDTQEVAVSPRSEVKAITQYDQELGFQEVGDGKDDRRRLLHYIDVVCSEDRLRSSTAIQALKGEVVEFHGNQYRIVGKVGEGGFGTVLKVEDKKTGELRALKVSHSFDITALQGGTDQSAVHTARKHVLDIASLHKLTRRGKDPETLQRRTYEEPAFPILHDAVLMPHPDAKNQRTFFEVMELVPGRTLLKFPDELDGSIGDQERVMQVCRRLIEIVDSLHKQGILHMDIKPKNIMITPSDDPILLDFGLVHQPELAQRQIDKKQAPYAVSTGRTTELQGDPLYAQQGEPLTTFRDVYGVGKTLNNLLTHYIRNNFSKPNDNRLYTPPSLQPLVDIVERMSEFNPKQRITLDQAMRELDRTTKELEAVA